MTPPRRRAGAAAIHAAVMTWRALMPDHALAQAKQMRHAPSFTALTLRPGMSSGN